MGSFRDKAESDPYANFLGIRIDEIGDGYASCSLVITREMFNFLGVVHGGLIFSLADAAFAAASNQDHLPSFALDISGSFVATPAVGDTVRAEAQRIHTTRRTGLYRLTVTTGGRLLATFNGTVFRKNRS